MTEQATAGHGHRVRLDSDYDVPGVWRCLDRSPTPGHWWITPADAEARDWVAAPECVWKLIQGCVEYPSRLMRPPDVAELF